MLYQYLGCYYLKDLSLVYKGIYANFLRSSLYKYSGLGFRKFLI